MPRQQQPNASQYVLQQISHFSRVKLEVITDAMTLKGDLLMNHSDLVFLSESLRAFVKHQNRKSTIRVSDVETKGLTVKALVTLVKERIKA